MSRMIKIIMATVASVAIVSVVPAEEEDSDSESVQPQAISVQKSIFQKMDRNGDGKVTAEEHEVRLKEWFKEMDKNGDGKLTSQEFGGMRFMETDLNKDGTITLEEYLVFFAGNDAPAQAEKTEGADSLYLKSVKEITAAEVIAYRKSVFKAINTSGNGRVTPAELNAYTGKEFEFLDRNKDRFILEKDIVIFAFIPVFACKTKEKSAAGEKAPPAVEKKVPSAVEKKAETVAE